MKRELDWRLIFYKNHENKTDSQNESIADPQASPEPKSQEQLTCWLYVSRTCTLDQQQSLQLQQQFDNVRNYRGDGLPRSSLEDAIRAVEPVGPWHVSETHCGLIAGFAREADADKLLQRGDLARIFEGPVQVSKFSTFLIINSSFHKSKQKALKKLLVI